MLSKYDADINKIANNDKESSSNISQVPEIENYEFIVRSADEELNKAANQSLSSEDKNKVVIYRRALQNTWDENERLRAAVIATRRKTENLRVENENLKEALIELSESIDYMGENKFTDQLNNQ